MTLVTNRKKFFIFFFSEAKGAGYKLQQFSKAICLSNRYLKFPRNQRTPFIHLIYSCHERYCSSWLCQGFWYFAGFSGANSRKNRPISRDFRGKKVKIRVFLEFRRISRNYLNFAGPRPREISEARLCCIKGFVYRLSCDSHLDIYCDVSAAFWGSSSRGSVDLLSWTIRTTVVVSVSGWCVSIQNIVGIIRRWNSLIYSCYFS